MTMMTVSMNESGQSGQGLKAVRHVDAGQYTAFAANPTP
jgi:hypothetical protein